MSPFWSEDCPARGAALHHAHWNQCTPEAHPGEESGHLPFQCCHCRAFDPAARAHRAPGPTPPPLDVLARMRALGFRGPIAVITVRSEEPEMQEDTGPEDIRGLIERDDDTPMEPRMVTGLGPQGKPWGEGRFHLPGELTQRDKQRLLRHVDFRLHLALNGGGEES